MGRMINSGVDVLRKSVMNLGDQHVQARGWHAQEASAWNTEFRRSTDQVSLNQWFKRKRGGGASCAPKRHMLRQTDIRWKDLTQIQCREHGIHVTSSQPFFWVVCVGQSSVISTCHPKPRAIILCLGFTCMFFSISLFFGVFVWKYEQ